MGAGALISHALGNLGGLVRDTLLAPVAYYTPRDWLVIRLDHGVSEAPRSVPGWVEGLTTAPRPLGQILHALELAREDAKLRGVIVRLGSAPLGWAKTSALARSFTHLKGSGKTLVAYAESAGNAGAWLGGLADHFWIAPEGRLDLLGVQVQGFFARRALDRLNIEPEVIAAGRYKSAAEIIDRDSMSEASRESLESVVDELYENLVAGLVSGRSADTAQAKRWIDEGPYLAAEAHEAGLVDELVYPDELPTRLRALESGNEDEDEEAHVISENAYTALARPRFVWHPLGSGRTEIAVVSLTGTIRRASSSPKGIVGQLRKLEKNDRVRAVVLRIDSPGGDSLASDLIWRAVARLSEQKPVVASMGDTAASGGYYAAMGAREIIAEAETLTGSIGVVLIGLGLEGLLDRVGVSTEAIKRGRHADLYDPLTSRSDENRAVLRRQVDRIYKDFVGKAAESRGRSYEELDEVAQGRVWTGAQAHARGLVDGIGGLDTAIERARALAGLGSDEGEAVYHAPPSSALVQMLRRSPLETALLAPGAQSLCPTRIPLN